MSTVNVLVVVVLLGVLVGEKGSAIERWVLFLKQMHIGQEETQVQGLVPRLTRALLLRDIPPGHGFELTLSLIACGLQG